MAYRVLTIDRELGSGAEIVAQKISTWLGWKLLDDDLITAIASAARVDPQVVSLYDEKASTRIPRISPRSRRDAINPTGKVIDEAAFFDAGMMMEFTHRVMDEAAAKGNCVIVGRGAQCILQHKPDVFHAFLYAPFQERVRRLQEHLEPGVNVEQRIRTVDQEHAEFLLQRFGKAWNSYQLYNLMLCSSETEDRTARVLLYAMTGQL